MGMVTFVWLIPHACEILLMETSLLFKHPLSADKCNFCRNLTPLRLGMSASEMLLQGPIQLFRHLHTCRRSGGDLAGEVGGTKSAMMSTTIF